MSNHLTVKELTTLLQALPEDVQSLPICCGFDGNCGTVVVDGIQGVSTSHLDSGYNGRVLVLRGGDDCYTQDSSK